MIVYHGTDSYSAQNIIENGIELKYGEESVDNAQGFYTTPNREFAVRRAQMVTEKAIKFCRDDSLKPTILQIEIDESAFDNLSVRKFDGCTYEWKEFVFYNRMGKRFLRTQQITSANHNLDHKYDIVIDETADSGVAEIVSSNRYKHTRNDINWESKISKIQKSTNECWGEQMSFHSQRAVRLCIKSMQIYEE